MIPAFSAILIAFALVASMPSPAIAQTETVLHTFSGTDGISPLLSLTFDSAGNIYGVTAEGGKSNRGTVFELSPGSNNTWTEKTLLSFAGGAVGAQPVGGVIFDAAGNLYGTTKIGGTKNVGVAYKLSPTSSGSWTETVIHNFGTAKDGQYPTQSLVMDSAGNLYGTTEGGGAYGNGAENVGGTAYKLSPSSTGSWTESVIHSFGHGTDGAVPQCNLIRDSSGNLYGTTTTGGADNFGTVFEVSPQSAGGWKEKVLYSFDPFNSSGDGWLPVAGLIFDKTGNLYGTTSIGGSLGGGTVFELSPEANGTWTETLLAGFQYSGFNPSIPDSAMVFDSAGNLYGTTRRGSGTNTLYDGTLFQLKPAGGGVWTLVRYFSFGGTNGAVPAVGSLTIDSAGNLYGSTQASGASNDGVVFKVTP